MHRYRVPRNVMGLTMRDGRKIDADSRGVIHVPERYAQDARDAMKDTQLLSDRDGQLVVRHAAEKECAGCGFCLYAWQEACPRCHAEQPALKPA